MFRRSRLLAYSALCALAVFTLTRLGLLIAHWPLIPHNPGELLLACFGALRFDLAVVGVLGLPGALWIALRKNRISWGTAGPLSWLMFLLWFVFLAYLAADTIFFIEHHVHFNSAVVDSLRAGVRGMLKEVWHGHHVILFGLAIAAAAAVFTTLVMHWSKTRLTTRMTVRRPGLFLIWLIFTGAALASLPLRGAPHYGNRILSELGTNGFYTLGYAWTTNDLVYGDFYDTLPDADALARARKRLLQPNQQFVNEEAIARQVDGANPPRRLNVVIVVETGLGADLIVEKGETSAFTPEFSKLQSQGLYFNQIYLTMPGTERLFESVLASYPPLPGAPLIQRKPARPLPTLATVLKKQGYRTLFIAGGPTTEDQHRFLSVNGFDRIIEQKDFANPAFTSDRGVADEDIFKLAGDNFEALAKESGPFFAVIVTNSNRSPYLYPPNRIDLNPGDHKRENAAKYADWALGEYFKPYEEKNYFKNTLFVIMGVREEAGEYTESRVPASYLVPMLLFAPNVIEPRQVKTLGSTIDLAPTILAILRSDYTSTFFGRDLIQLPETEGCALMQRDRNLEFINGPRAAVLSPAKATRLMEFDPDRRSLKPIPAEDDASRDVINDAIALYQTAYEAFDRALKRKSE